MNSQFKLGELVLAKMKGFSYWPAQVATPIRALGNQPPGQTCVLFFGSNDYAWIDNDKIKIYTENRHLITGKKTGGLKKAITEIEAYIQTHGKTSNERSSIENESSLQDGVDDGDLSKGEEDEGEEEKKAAKPKPRKSMTTKRTSQRSSIIENGTASPAKKRKPAERVEKQKDDNDEKSSYVYGFIGLGIMGSHIVNNLIKANQKVNIWNKTRSKAEQLKRFMDVKYKPLVDVKERVFDLVQNSDIIFVCVSDAVAVSEIIYSGDCLLNETFSFDKKGIVIMTNISHERSVSFEAEISERKGLYLEAQLQGTPEDASKGELILLTAGDETLFKNCKSVFKTIGKTAFYLGKTVGIACKMNVVLQVIKGITLVGVTEAMCFAERCAINLKDLVEIFTLSNLESPYLVQNANYVADKNTSNVDNTFRYLQKDFRMALQLADTLKQPLLMTSTANESIIKKFFW